MGLVAGHRNLDIYKAHSTLAAYWEGVKRVLKEPLQRKLDLFKCYFCVVGLQIELSGKKIIVTNASHSLFVLKKTFSFILSSKILFQIRLLLPLKT